MEKIKTINTNEEVPDEFYISLIYENNIIDQINKTNYINTKKIKSAGFNNVFIKENKDSFLNGNMNYLPSSTGITTNFLSPLILKHSDNYYKIPTIENIKNYTTEIDIELIRKKYYKKYPSRFSGIFAFGDIETCKKVCSKHNWDLNSFKKFKLIDTEEFNDYIKVGKFNMDILSLLKDPYMHILPKKENELAESYWEGSKKVNNIEFYNTLTHDNGIFNLEIIPEYIIEGVLKEIPY
jgi:hypothetical protein